MAIHMPCIIQARQILKRPLSNGGSTPASMDIPKGYFAIYVGEQEKKRFVVPVSILSEPRFQQLLHQSEQEFVLVHLCLYFVCIRSRCKRCPYLSSLDPSAAVIFRNIDIEFIFLINHESELVGNSGSRHWKIYKFRFHSLMVGYTGSR
ncbi:putative small auxin-up RNA [Helianthus debilis subsp. tardiflorus]